ncbi:head-tail connector protein [Clostridium sp. Marseille-Q2269]|uniref:head-tail connector protein n=1 Tax=Clostridium sp. Marseille-Q2269 TaxID=2942205 RepID=UPI0020731B34|nr:head-tail connector protein [Clostridium sp. Marseille-Q2269]
MLEKIKLVLRFDDDEFDGDIGETIEAAKADLELCGVDKNKINETDPLILRAIKTFCKAEFSTDIKEAERYRKSYESIRDHMTLSKDYTEVT